jgi:hypothetical protein
MKSSNMNLYLYVTKIYFVAIWEANKISLFRVVLDSQ